MIACYIVIYVEYSVKIMVLMSEVLRSIIFKIRYNYVGNNTISYYEILQVGLNIYHT